MNPPNTPEWRSVVAETRAQDMGNCYEAAGTLIIRSRELGLSKPTLIHASCAGQGELLGQWVDHAWVEADIPGLPGLRLAIDFSNQKELIVFAAVYRHVGRPRNVREYSAEEALIWMSRTQHFGPWEDIE